MNAAELTAEILQSEGVEFLAYYSRNALIESYAAAGIRLIICRQELVGVGIADDYSRTAVDNNAGVFAAVTR